jgi:dihydrofolate reductase
MLIYSMSVSVDGFIADRKGAFGWTTPNEEQFRFHITQIRELGGCLCGRRLYETMLPWETDPASGGTYLVVTTAAGDRPAPRSCAGTGPLIRTP